MPAKKNRQLVLLFGLLALGLLAAFRFPSETKNTCPLKVQYFLPKSGVHYTVFWQENLKADFLTTRPLKTDNSVCLCIPAAFTQLDNYAVDGLCISNGKASNTSKINHSVGGAVKVINGKVSLFPTSKGSLLTPALIQSVVDAKGSLFQQIMLIEDGKAASFKDTAEFQRRAIVQFRNGKIAVAESYEHIRLALFSKDLAALGVVNAIYTDMGSWDEGWYRDPKNCQPETIGRIRLHTDKQSNWFVFRK